MPFVVKNYNILPDDEKEKISNIHHVFCGLHVLPNLGIYAEKSLIDREKTVEEEGILEHLIYFMKFLSY